MILHYLHSTLLNNPNPTTINLIGAGGTGSNIVTQLARIHHSLRALGQPGLAVTLFDPDTVSQANIGRQLFSPSDIGLNKASILIHRINTFLGTAWTAIPERYSIYHQPANITITAVDTVKARIDINRILTKNTRSESFGSRNPLYWMDCGNTQLTGQVLMGTLQSIPQPESQYVCTPSLPTIIQKFPDLKKHELLNTGPSCSVAEALNKQDLFINSMIAQICCKVLWDFLKNGFLDNHGSFINLATMKMTPIKITLP